MCNQKKQIAIIESFYGGSHKSWADSIQKLSANDVQIFSLEPNYWKWRLRTGAITLARKVNESNLSFDTFLVSDLIDLVLFKSLLLDKYSQSKFILYFHENQLTYPWSKNFRNENAERKVFAFTNANSAFIADKVVFNSNFHRDIFFKEFRKLYLEGFDHQEDVIFDKIEIKSLVISPGINYKELCNFEKKLDDTPIILWNHRFEHDKNPVEFLNLLSTLKSEGLKFKLNLLGEVPDVKPEVYSEILDKFSNEIINYGYLKKDNYIEALKNSHILPVTSMHDFFGISVVEAMSAGVFPLLPKRLAYPEHIQSEFKEVCLYNNFNELISKTKKSILEFSKLPFKKISESISRYDMSKEIVKYDDLISFS